MKTIQKQLLILMLSATPFTGLLAQDKERTTQERNPTSFNAIEINDYIEVILSQGPVQSVKVETEDQSNIITEVKNNVLIIEVNKKERREKEEAKVYVTFVKLNSIVQNGVTEVSSTGSLTFDSLQIEQTGASELELKITTGTLKADISGAGQMKLSGTAKNSIVSISGAGDFDAQHLATLKTKVDISGAGNAEIDVKDELNANISGVGNLSFKEEPAVKNIEISGFGSVNGEKNKSFSYNYNYSYPAPPALPGLPEMPELPEMPGYPGYDNGEKAKDSTKFKWGDKRVIIIDGEDDEDDDEDHQDFNRWAGLDISMNSFLNRNNTTTLPPGYEFLELDYAHSLNLDFNIFEKHIHIFRNYVNIASGLGLRFSSYGFKNNITLIPDTDRVAAVPSAIKEFRKNKLNSTWVTAPVMLEFNSRDYSDKCWHLSAGVLLGYKLGSRTKQVYEEDGDKKKEINRGDYSLNPFKCDAMVRVGYGNFRIFATYALSELFEKGEGPQLYPFTVGLTLINF